MLSKSQSLKPFRQPSSGCLKLYSHTFQATPNPMTTLLYPHQNQTITLHIRQTAKKNIIMRPRDAHSVSINIPKWLTQRALIAWLDAHPHFIQQTLAKTPIHSSKPTFRLPENIWFQGQRHSIQLSSQTEAEHQQNIFRLPETWNTVQQQTWLRDYYIQAATQILLPKLQQHSQQLHLNPAAIALTHAKTYWGVCRARTGIRLNWRLIAAPEFVQDYVCIHELCHLPHPNHSPAFWAAVHQATPHTDQAKTWLKTHGKELFILG
ncbi:M48 family metallopeptidase [Neisseriaceae bacterium B1]